jgi:hypothetical protein
MSSIQYNPNPPRVWSRVQNPCSAIAYKNDDPAAYSNFFRADYEKQMLLKGNILQYKKNSSSLTKKQRYTQIAKGMWINRTKTWATQSDTYTNPNMSSLLRVNSSVLDPSNNIFSNRSNPFGCPTNAIPDGGNLVCNVVVNPCTQEVIKRTRSQQLCNPTTDSDVPGQIQQLCWNDGTQTWYPRQRYIMPTSGTKWPQGYKGFVSAVTFVGPILSVGNVGCGLSIPLNWTFLNSTCAPITSFNIYQNGILILNVPVSITSVIIDETLAGTYMFYVTSLSNTIESEKSNEIVVSTEYGYSTENAVITNNGKTITFLINGTITIFCEGFTIVSTLVGGGGGGGGGSYVAGGGGGGGGGGEIKTLSFVSTITTYSVIVGNGGTNGISGKGSSDGNGGPGGNGNNSEIIGIVISSGGYGGNGGQIGGDSGQNVGGNGGNSGSGGSGGNGGTTTILATSGVLGGGGGGGCYFLTFQQGANGSTNGGDGYGSGGGGGSSTNNFNNPPGINGGIGGINAGNGSLWNTNGGNGIPNKGGGGGGGQGGNSGNAYNGGNGGSGIVILNIL